jgi:glycosyltransferase involved in cell wall biosynthesis
MFQPPLHICLISEEYPPDTGWGGIGTYTYNLARGLAAAGHRVEVVAGALHAAATQVEEGVTVHRIGFAPPRNALKRGIYRAFQAATVRAPYLRRKLEFAQAAGHLVSAMHRRDPVDICESAEYDANGSFVAWRGEPPLVVKVHTPLLFNYRLNGLPLTREARLCDRLERFQVRRARAVTSPSRRMAELAADWLGCERRPAVVPNPIDTAAFSPEGTRIDHPPYLYFTGRLERRKGVHLLLEAFRGLNARHPDLRLVLAGHDTPTFRLGGENLHFRDFAARTGLMDGLEHAVEFLGRMDRRDLPPWYRGSIACVFPSADFENFPYACLEAMACGRGVLVTDAGGMAEMIEDGRSGLCVAAGAAAPLEAAMERLVADPVFADRLGAGARRRVLGEYDLPAVTARTVQIYREVLNA